MYIKNTPKFTFGGQHHTDPSQTHNKQNKRPVSQMNRGEKILNKTLANQT